LIDVYKLFLTVTVMIM